MSRPCSLRIRRIRIFSGKEREDHQVPLRDASYKTRKKYFNVEFKIELHDKGR